MMQSLGDFGVRAAVGDQAKDLGLARGQRRELGVGGSLRREARQDDVRDSRIEVRAALAGDPNRIDDPIRIRALETVGVGAGRQRCKNFFFEVDHRHDDDTRRRELRAHPFGQRNAVERRDADIDHRDVGAFARNRLPAGKPVGRLGNHVARRLQRRAQARARERVIFDDDDAGALPFHVLCRHRKRQREDAAPRRSADVRNGSTMLLGDSPDDVKTQPAPRSRTSPRQSAERAPALLFAHAVAVVFNGQRDRRAVASDRRA